METTSNNLKTNKRVKYYQIDDVYTDFATLSDAKMHIWFYSRREILKNFYPKTYICGYNSKGELISITTVFVNEEGVVRYSRTSKLLVPCATLQ